MHVRHADTLKAAGKQRVTLSFRQGASALQIRKVSVMQDGRVLAEDVHEGWTGKQHLNNEYHLDVKQLAVAEPVFLVMEVEPSSSIQTAGEIQIQRDDDEPVVPQPR